LAIICTTWLWGDAYAEHYVRRLASGLKRHIKQKHRVLCFVDRTRHLPWIEQYPIQNTILTQVKGCFARLRLFDPVLQERIGAKPGDSIVNFDLDAVTTGGLDELLDRQDGFAILQGINTTNPCPYNGSLWMLKAGYRPDVWSEFSLAEAAKVPFHAFPDDQGWFHHKMPDAGAFGPLDGVYGFKKKGWPAGDDLPENARLVAFPGWRDPEKFMHLPWIKQHWTL
jgi:hypothetical protein